MEEHYTEIGDEESEPPTHSQPQNAGEEIANNTQVRTLGMSTLGKLEQKLLNFDFFRNQIEKMMSESMKKRKDESKIIILNYLVKKHK